MTPDPSQSVAEAMDTFRDSLKALLPQVWDSIARTQSRYKRDYDKKVRTRRVSQPGYSPEDATPTSCSPATSGCRHRRWHAGGSQARRDTRSRWLPWPLPADHRCPTRGRAKYRPSPLGEDGSPAAAGGFSRGARAGRLRRHGTTPAGPPPGPRGRPPGASPPR